MPPVYNSLIDRDDVAALIPEDASRQIIQDLPEGLGGAQLASAWRG